MKKNWVLLIVFIALVLIAGCIGNNSKSDNKAVISTEQKAIQTPHITASQTPIITSNPTTIITITPTPRVTSTPTSKITSIPTPRVTSTPLPRKTSTPTPKVTKTPSNTNYAQTSSNDAVSCPAGKCWVNPYTKKDGTKVRGYCRKC